MHKLEDLRCSGTVNIGHWLSRAIELERTNRISTSMEPVFRIPCMTVVSQTSPLLLPHHPVPLLQCILYTVGGSRVKHQLLLKIGTIQQSLLSLQEHSCRKLIKSPPNTLFFFFWKTMYNYSYCTFFIQEILINIHKRYTDIENILFYFK